MGGRGNHRESQRERQPSDNRITGQAVWGLHGSNVSAYYVQTASRVYDQTGALFSTSGKRGKDYSVTDSAEEPLWSKSDSEKDHLRCIPRQFKSRTDEASA